MRRVRALVLIAVLAMVAAACGGAADTAGGDDGATTGAVDDDGAAPLELEPVRVTIANLRAIQYFPVYVADAGGYFEAEGLDVGEIEIVSGSGAVVQQLIAGNTDVMVANPAAAIAAVAGEQADLVNFCSTHYENIFTLATPTSTGITDVSGLEGGVVGITEPSGGEVPVVRAALATAGLVDGEDYELLAIGEGGQLTFEALNNGDAVAYSSSVFDVAAIEAQGLELTHVLPDEFVYVPSIGLTVTRETFDNSGDLLARFGRAMAKAQTWASQPDNREAANELMMPYNAELFEDPAFVDAVWDATLGLMTPPDDMGDAPTCAHYIPGWETYVEASLETPVEEGGIEGEIDIPAMADESLVEQINEFDPADVEPPSAG